MTKRNQTVFVVGHKGMLGHVLCTFFREKGWTVETTDSRFEGTVNDPLLAAVTRSSASWIVNALGRIKQKNCPDSELFSANTTFPYLLKGVLGPQQRLVHVSTDCVFNGNRGNYRVTEKPDALPSDFYGVSKALGEGVQEKGKCWIIRTSMIGPELSAPHGLMGWFLSQKKSVKGYRNHLWNGLTTLEWAKVCLALMNGKLEKLGTLIQPACAAPISKYDLLRLMGKIFHHPVEISPTDTAEPVIRTLEPNLPRPDIEKQLQELQAWYSTQTVLKKSA